MMITKYEDRCYIHINGYDADGKFVHGLRRVNQNVQDIRRFVARFREIYPQCRAIVVRVEFPDYYKQQGSKHDERRQD